MKKLLAVLSLVFGLSGCSTAPSAPTPVQPTGSPPTPAMTDAQRYENEKVELERATAVGTSTALNDFIAAHPDSAWRVTAIHRRDGAALEEAKRIGTKEAFEEFLRRYPASDWAEQARYFLQYGVPGQGQKG